MNYRVSSGLALVVLAMYSEATRAETVALPQVEVTAERDSSYVSTDENSPATVYQIGREGIDLFGSGGNSNPYMVVSRLPSVNAHSADAYGLVNIPGGTKGLRVRGELTTHGGGGTVDGLPLTGINPGPGNQWLFDLENIESITLRQGPIAPDRFAFFTTGGALDSAIAWPKSEGSFDVAQSLGSYNFRRTFMRADSGRLANGSQFFVSASYTDADKWRGPGKSPDGRENIEVAWSHPLGERGNGKLLVAHNDYAAHNYRPLSYAQASDLGTWRKFDYSATSSAVATQAVNFYGYNRQAFESWVAIGELEYGLGETGRISVKPYYLKEQGDYFDGMANGKVRNWLIDHDWYGITAEGQARFADVGVKVGYWYESSDPPGPPTAWKMYNPTAAGGLGSATWSILADTTARHRFDSVYALADYAARDLKLQAGGRYVRETVPGFDFYNTAGIGDVSYEQALAKSSGVVANRSASSFVIDEFLPFASLDYALDATTRFKLSLGRNYGAPAFDVWPVFQQSSATFLAKGITANDLWHTMKAETSDALDIGLDMRSARGYFAPTIYYARNRNVKVSYDPGIGVAYSQNTGKTRSYGAQAAAGWTSFDHLDLFAAVSYNRIVFDEDLPLMNGKQLAVSGKQLPDTPQWQANLGATWSQGGFSVTPMVRYMGSRYGDTQHAQKIDGYTTADLSLGYQRPTSLGKLSASLAVQNLFDKEYIGFINASYYQLLSNTSAFYYPGSPRTLVARVMLDF